MTSLHLVDCPLLEKALSDHDNGAIWNYFDFLKKNLERAERQRDSLLLLMKSLEKPLPPVTVTAHPPKKSSTKALAREAPEIDLEDLGL